MKKSLQRIFRSQKQRDVSAPHIKQRAKVDAVSIRKENNRMRLFFFKSGDWREQMINEKDTKQICAFTLSGCPRIAPGVKSPEIRRNRVCVFGLRGWQVWIDHTGRHLDDKGPTQCMEYLPVSLRLRLQRHHWTEEAALHMNGGGSESPAWILRILQSLHSTAHIAWDQDTSNNEWLMIILYNIIVNSYDRKRGNNNNNNRKPKREVSTVSG